MSEAEVRRVVIACDAQCDIDAAVREAAELAGHWRVPLHGIFLLDENLLRLAELPFSREVSLCVPDVSGTLEPGELRRLLAALSASMRRVIEVAAKDEGVVWSFAEERDLSDAAAVAVLAGDMLVIDASVRPFSGSWRPRSLREHTLAHLDATVLVRRNEKGRHPCVVVVLDTNTADHERTLAAVRSLTGARDRLHALIQEGSGGKAGLPALVSHPEVSVEHVSLDFADLRDRIAQLNPRLMAVETSAFAAANLEALIANTRCDLLLVGKPQT
jgi:hypothetical protein